MSDRGYTLEPFPPFRQLVIDGMEIASRKHLIHGLVEVDITKPRQCLQEIQLRTGERLSFTGFMVYCCARAVDENKHVHAYRDWRNRLVLFDDVDISLPVEVTAGNRAASSRAGDGWSAYRRTDDGLNEVLQITIRAANRKSIWEIHQEIRQAQTKGLKETVWGKNLHWYLAVPALLRRLLIRAASGSPHLVKKMNGTVLVTPVGMFGRGAGWGIPMAGHTLSITVGGIVSRPGIRDGRLEDREHLCLTASFDHDLVDGAPAARFIQRFRELVEDGRGLGEAVGRPGTANP